MAFYVSVLRSPDRGPRGGAALAAGPYRTHGAALAAVDAVRRYLCDEIRDFRAYWYAYGTCRVARGGRDPGRLNEALGLAARGYCDPIGLP